MWFATWLSKVQVTARPTFRALGSVQSMVILGPSVVYYRICCFTLYVSGPLQDWICGTVASTLLLALLSSWPKSKASGCGPQPCSLPCCNLVALGLITLDCASWTFPKPHSLQKAALSFALLLPLCQYRNCLVQLFGSVLAWVSLLWDIEQRPPSWWQCADVQGLAAGGLDGGHSSDVEFEGSCGDFGGIL